MVFMSAPKATTTLFSTTISITQLTEILKTEPEIPIIRQKVQALILSLDHILEVTSGQNLMVPDFPKLQLMGMETALLIRDIN